MLAVRAESLGKEYRRGALHAPYKTAREALVRAIRPARRPEPAESNRFWAFRDVSFELAQGGALAVIGRNGAGKTTLLKVLSRITRPTAGLAEVRGRVGTLLEVGTGFHAELTGRENIRLNGAILGMSRRDIAARFDEIVEFAEVGKFIDTPVKRYSSGMFMRLAFSVAAHLEPDILIVDEVLAVGDAAFQKKCLGKLGEVGGEGRTVIFVSHNMAAVTQICSRAILLEGGRVAEDGPVDDVVDSYMRNVADSTDEIRLGADTAGPVAFTRLATRNADGTLTSRFANDEPIVLEAEYVVRERLSGDHVWVILYRADGLLLIKANDDDLAKPATVKEPGTYVTRFTIPGNVLNEGGYQFRVSIGKRRGVTHDDQYSGYFQVEDMTDYTESDFGKRNGVLLLPVSAMEERL
jgi:lipopolysaccharide transport system ATP-binding protein